jgi:hypothetical protein
MFVYLEMLGEAAVRESKKISIACCVRVASGSQSSGMLCHVNWCIGTDVLQEHDTPVFSVLAVSAT